MKSILIIKKAINIFYYLFIMAFAVEAIKFMYYLFLGNFDKLKPLFIDDAINYTDTSGILTVVSNIIGLGLIYLFVLIAENLRLSTFELEQQNYFNDVVINSFKKAGSLLLIFAAIKFVSKFIFPVLLNTSFKLSSGHFPIFYVLIGLFFVFLSEVFKKAKTATQENDLTI